MWMCYSTQKGYDMQIDVKMIYIVESNRWNSYYNNIYHYLNVRQDMQIQIKIGYHPPIFLNCSLRCCSLSE